MCSVDSEGRSESRLCLSPTVRFFVGLLLSVLAVRPSVAQTEPCSVLIDYLSVDESGNKDRPALFDARGRLVHCNYSGPITYEWDFGDGHKGSGEFTWHNYTSGGTKTWSLTVDARGATAATSGQIVIDPVCQCILIDDVVGPYGREAGEPVAFELVPPADCCGSLPAIEWGFGDGSEVVKDVLSTEHAYVEPGVYHWYVKTEAGAYTNITSGDVSIGPDLIADRVEVVQAVQDLKNSVRLVEEKPTFVRFYAHSAKGNYPVSARLTVEGPDKGAYLYPINPGGKVMVRPTYLRDALDHAFLFEVPSELLHGDDVSFKAEVNPSPFGPIAESDHVFERDSDDYRGIDNNSVEARVAFESVPPFHLILYAVEWGGAPLHKPGEFHQDMLESWLRRTYPISSMRVIRRSYDYSEQHGPGKPINKVVNGDLATKRDWDVNNRWFSMNGIPTTARYYGMVYDGGGPAGFMQGLAMGIPSFIASGPTGDGSFPWDTDGSYGDWYGAHELGHTWKRYHAEYCGAVAKGKRCLGGGRDGESCSGGADCPGGTCTLRYPPDYVPYPYANGNISGAPSGDEAFYGFDALTHALYGPAWKDLMTYCSLIWVSDFTYEGLMDRMQLEGSGGGAAAAGATSDRLLVVGSIDPATNVAQLQPLFILPNAAEVQPRVPGPYAIVLRNTAGAELARYPFTPSAAQADPAPNGAAGELDTVLFVDELVPYVAGTDRVDIEGSGGTVLATVRAGSNAPSVRVLSPNGGEVLGGTTIPVSWTGSDLDGDPLTFNVQYSRDNGSSWEMVAQNLTGTSVELDASNFPAGSQARIRVWASDGIHTASDQSDGTFTVPNHVPSVAITQPESDITIVVGQTLHLKGDAYDIDTGTMPSGFSQSVDWSSDLDGYLGSGGFLALTLSEGIHTVTFSADDGRGGVASDSVRVTVFATLSDLPLVPDALSVAPTLLVFDSDGGTTSASVSVDNRNTARAIGWNAAASDTWLKLSTDAGVTPDLITVSFDETGLAPGRHGGTITFTSDTVPTTSQIVEAEVTIPGTGPACTGDCNGNGNVTVDELVRGVNIALGTTGLDQCVSLDTSGNGIVTVDELIKAVNNALSGCG
jgi:hypothetical protein